ncbi:PilZ domain-containing protein [Silvanigrella aquatica]|uniref:PilZ domain-containing protein n=1 Tax=Silvanigrella aquatica TaxID=1915309 RepID=A0A1L4CY43_9BACT|nr:PilZ domain-containing protein [Silvanigrella aquatica]APJ02868.1 hypothetical protein AXG55_02605 [Silvanigrella aquatica]
MGLDENNASEQRNAERFKSSIPVLIQKKGLSGTCECTLLNISTNGFSVRIENGKLNINVGDDFFLIIDPKLFDIEELNKIKINSICKRIESNMIVVGAEFTHNVRIVNEMIKLISNYFEKINENDY